VSTPVSGNSPDPDPLGGVDPGARLPGSGQPAKSGTGDVDAVVVVPVEIPVPVIVPVPVEATDPVWSGTVIEPAPTTADDIAALVLAIPDVVRLHAGRFGEVATYLPGRRITGVKLGDDTVEVHVVVAASAPIRQTAQLIHAAVATLIATPVHVYVEDVAVA
jgi:hypothetical protein